MSGMKVGTPSRAWSMGTVGGTISKYSMMISSRQVIMTDLI